MLPFCMLLPKTLFYLMKVRMMLLKDVFIRIRFFKDDAPSLHGDNAPFGLCSIQIRLIKDGDHLDDASQG